MIFCFCLPISKQERHKHTQHPSYNVRIFYYKTNQPNNKQTNKNKITFINTKQQNNNNTWTLCGLRPAAPALQLRLIITPIYRVPPPPPKKKKGTVDLLGLCSDQRYRFSPCWIEHLFLIIITPRSSNLVENFLFYE